MTLRGKYALVTGGSRGIGRGIALKLAECGARVAVHYYQKEDQAKATLEKLRASGSDGFVLQADVCKPEEIRRMFARVKSEFGALDIFVNNARPEVATFYEGPMTIALDMFDFAINSQAKAFLVGVQEAAPMMRDGGRIIASHDLCARRPHRKLAAVGGHGCGQGGIGSFVPLLRRGPSSAADHRERHQSGLDRRQRVEYTAGNGTEHYTELAPERMDSHAETRDAGRPRKCRRAALLGGSELDHRNPGCGRRRLAHGCAPPTGNPATARCMRRQQANSVPTGIPQK